MFEICIVTCAFILLDILTGIVKGVATSALSSKIMRAGLLHKLSLILIAALGFLIDYAQKIVDLGFQIPIATALCGYIICMEIISILENVSTANPDIVPDKILALFGSDVAARFEAASDSDEGGNDNDA